ncbi:hypothetical protein FHS04_002333 [Mesoflavibacter sabulilitoris]|nr:hypothetical protein [Mesoflavibacter zeaxanthinifaciens subsp. sabulilitoris]
MNHFSICTSCSHVNTCVLTAQKDKVWSCSEYDESLPDEVITEVETFQERKSLFV